MLNEPFVFQACRLIKGKECDERVAFDHGDFQKSARGRKEGRKENDIDIDREPERNTTKRGREERGERIEVIRSVDYIKRGLQ